MEKGFLTNIAGKLNGFKLGSPTLTLLLLSLFLFQSCLTNNASPSKRRAQQGVINTSGTVSVGHGRILQDNPIILTNNPNLQPDVNLDTLLKIDQDYIVDDQFLTKTCYNNLAGCMSVQENKNTPQFNSSDAKWAYPTNTVEFLQVNTFGHVSKTIDRFHEDLVDLHTENWGTPFLPYNTAIPRFVFANNAHWLGSSNLKAFADCDIINNARFDPAAFTLCFGRDSEYEYLKFAHDPTVIYHEMGHAINHIALNMRNTNLGTLEKSGMGYIFYDEAGSIGEGISDWLSYMMTYPQRPHFGEWALGRFNLASRPMSEDDPIHVAGLSTDDDGRLSYPQYIHYDPNQPDKPFEDIHVAGQIISHFLVALVQDLENSEYCHLDTKVATSHVFNILLETFAELGDLSSFGSDNNLAGYVNLNANHAAEWVRVNRPINFRSFSQKVAKNVKRILIDQNKCSDKDDKTILNVRAYSRDRFERLMDSYGLLLFKNYNENGDSFATGLVGATTTVEPINRLKTTLIPKDLLIYDPTANAAKAFVIDNRSGIKSVYDNMSAAGMVGSLSSQLEADLPFNNGNAKISPGELVGVVLNLYNNSNSAMAGVQVLANDWDHVKWDDTALGKPYKKGKLCNTMGDNFPLSSEGAADTSSESPPTPGDCTYITQENGDELNEQLAPSCFVEINEDNATKWGLQEEFRSKIALEPENCLSGAADTRDCFIRVLKGADQAFFSKIDPKKNYAQTILPAGGTPTFNSSNLIFLEVSPWIPPGTTFNCRFRTRFTNCDDCFSDNSLTNGEDFRDFEFSGGKPFKLINFQFTVID